LATALFEHKKVHTTEAKAKELRPFAERLITKAIHALQNEQQGNLHEGQTIDIHNRRVVGKFIRNKAVLQELFDSIAPAVGTRNGGYTRIVKTGIRRGDAARTAIIELVDFSTPQDGAFSLSKKKKVKGAAAKPAVKATPKVVAPIAKTEEVVPEAVVEEPIIVTDEVAAVEETLVAEEIVAVEEPVVETVVEAPAAEVVAEEAPATEIEAPAEEAKTDDEAPTEDETKKDE
jgi:large subunit ribosomal protein L17